MYLDVVGVPSNQNYANVQAGYAAGSGADTVTCLGSAIFSETELSNAQLFGIDNVVSNKGTSASPISSATLTTLVPNEILYAMDTGVSSATVLTAQAPFTDLGPNFSFDAGYQPVTTVTGYSSSFTMTLNADGHWNTFLAGFRPSAGAVARNIRHRAQVIRYRKSKKYKILLATANRRTIFDLLGGREAPGHTLALSAPNGDQIESKPAIEATEVDSEA